MYLKKWIVVIVVLVFTAISNGLYAQENMTPTPAPSKTPTGVPDTKAQENPEEPTFQLVQPWTQADLSILTGNVQRPNGVVWYNGKLYTACNGDFTIYEIDDTTAETRTYIWGVRNAHTLYAETTVQGELNLWVPDFQTNQIVRVDRNGVDTVLADLAGPWGIAYLNESDFLVTTLRGNSLILVNRNGESRDILTDLRSPTGVVLDGDYTYIANTGSARRAIEWITMDGVSVEATEEGIPTTAHPLVTGLQNVTDLVMAEDGNLYFAYSLGTRGVVGRIDPELCRTDEGCTNDQVEIVLYTELAAPLAGLVITPDMRLFVHTMFSPDIYWLYLEGDNDL